MLQTPTGQPNEKDILLFNIEHARQDTLQIIEEIRKEYGLGEDVLGWKPAKGAHTIGWLLGHIGANEWMATNRMHKLVKKPPIGGEQMWNKFVYGTRHPDSYPPAEELLQAMTEVRVHLKDVMRSASYALLDTVLVPEIKEVNWTVRLTFLRLPMHERFHAGEIRYIQKYLLPKDRP